MKKLREFFKKMYESIEETQTQRARRILENYQGGLRRWE
jgi:hypothetical protein